MFKLNYTTILIFTLPLYVFGNMSNISQYNETTPVNLYISGPDLNPAINLIYPGLFQTATKLRISAGYLKQDNSAASYMWQPVSSYDNNRNEGNFSPYLLAQIEKKNILSGVYLGNVVSDFANHNSSSPLDTVNSFNKDHISMEGGLWVAPNLRILKGISFYSRGNYLNRNMHFLNAGEWKDLHTIYNYNLESGYGILSALFAINDKNSICARFEYGKNIISANEQQLDTLIFSKNSFVSSNLTRDSSHTTTLSGCYLDYLFQPSKKSSIYGIKFGANRTNIDLKSSSADSTMGNVSCFAQKILVFDPLSFYTGAILEYAAIFYNKAPSRLGYYDLVTECTWSKSNYLIDIQMPLVIGFKIGNQFELLGGAQLHFNHNNSNYDFYNDVSVKSSSSHYGIEFLPISFRYSSKKHIIFSCTPSIDSKFVVSGIDISYTF